MIRCGSCPKDLIEVGNEGVFYGQCCPVNCARKEACQDWPDIGYIYAVLIREVDALVFRRFLGERNRPFDSPKRLLLAFEYIAPRSADGVTRPEKACYSAPQYTCLDGQEVFHLLRPPLPVATRTGTDMAKLTEAR
jgi:hypothetical protein